MENGKPLTIGVSTSALLDMRKEQAIMDTKGLKAYCDYQQRNRKILMKPGPIFDFIRLWLDFNRKYPEEVLTRVVLLSRNNPITAERAFMTFEHYGLDIKRGGFLSNASPIPYLKPFNVSLFLTANEVDARAALAYGVGAGMVLPGQRLEAVGEQLRIGFDFDGVAVDDEAETVYKTTRSVTAFTQHERAKRMIPHTGGPLKRFIVGLMRLRELDRQRFAQDSTRERDLLTGMFTARENAAQGRCNTTLKSWGAEFDQTFYVSGGDKTQILKAFKPHIYFDDQLCHLSRLIDTPAVHVPYGIANLKQEEVTSC